MECEYRPEVIKEFSCSTQLRMKFFLLMNFKMPEFLAFYIYGQKKMNILGLCDPIIDVFLGIFKLMCI